MEFKDWLNPTDAELREWALGANSYCPEQDFDILIATPERISLFIEIVKDENYPQPRFFLSCLYLMIGDAVRSNYRVYSREFVEELMERCRTAQSAPLELLVERAKVLISEPQTFDYNDWCWGGLARQTTLS